MKVLPSFGVLLLLADRSVWSGRIVTLTYGDAPAGPSLGIVGESLR